MHEASVNYKELEIVKKTKRISSPFSSPLFKLIEFTYKNHPDIALFILRQRITLSYSPSNFEIALIKVAAKRYSVSEALDAKSNSKINNLRTKNVSLKNTGLKNIRFKTQLTNKEAMDLAIQCSRKSKQRDERFRSDRQVGAVLLDSQNRLLSTGYNKASVAKFHHAEFNCVRSFWNRTKTFIPVGAKLFVTLKPCKMCAALLFDCSQAPETLQIYYLNNDPGPFAKDTLLESQIRPYNNFFLETCAGSP